MIIKSYFTPDLFVISHVKLKPRTFRTGTPAEILSVHGMQIRCRGVGWRGDHKFTVKSQSKHIYMIYTIIYSSFIYLIYNLYHFIND